VIAAFNGYALHRFLITLCCDIILASENAEFGLRSAAGNHSRLRRCGTPGSLCRPRQGDGDGIARWRITAAEAYRVGLVNKVVPLPELMPLAFDYAKRLAACHIGSADGQESPHKGLDIASSRKRRRRHLPLHAAGPDRGQPRSASSPGVKSASRCFGEVIPSCDST